MCTQELRIEPQTWDALLVEEPALYIYIYIYTHIHT